MDSEWRGSAGRPKSPGQSSSSPSSPSSPSFTTDHVFPIRSAISVDESQTPSIHSRNPSSQGFSPPYRDSISDGRSPVGNSRFVGDTSSTTLSPLSPGDRVPSISYAFDIALASRLGQRNASIASTSTSQAPSSHGQSSVAAAPPAREEVASAECDENTIEKSDWGSAREARSSLASQGETQSGDSNIPAAGEQSEPYMTTRFKHVMTDEGHAIITGPESTPQRCEDEPIHAPGAVQAFGLLVVLRDEGGGEGAKSQFSVRIVSENSRNIIGYSPQELFKLSSFMEILSEEQAVNLLDHIDFIRDEGLDPAVSGPDVFIISVRPPESKPVRLWCAVHINSSHPDLIICEFEPEDDKRYPIRPPNELVPEEPEDTLCQTPTAEELHQSISITSKPLRALRSAQNLRGEAGAMQMFNIMSQVQEQFASAPNLKVFLKILVDIVKELTGFHRVMIYQFDASFNGKVVAEVIDPVQTRDLFHGLHFPASDIPKQARELYKLNKVRLLYDRDLESARLVCRTLEDLDKPLDLSHAYLRAMSPIHLKYLANMAVRSSMSISINAFNELWGLISCHGYGAQGMRVSFPIRKMCRMVGDATSQNVERLSYASRLEARRLIVNAMPSDKRPSGYIMASSDDLLKLLDADFGMLSIGDETEILGKVVQSQEALAMLEYLRLRSFSSVITTHDIAQDFPDLRYTPGFSIIAGLLYVPLSVGGDDFIVFFRKSQVREVKWAGNPYEKVTKEGTTGFLEPRSSFKAWRETVVDQCREWTEEQVETASILCLVYGKFIHVWRQKEAALQNSRLTRLLLANSAHEVRTPLNAIINYLEIALEESIDRETRDNLAKTHSASKSLIYVINDLLDLTKAEEGQKLVKDEIIDLPACIAEATEPFRVVAQRKGILYEVIEHEGVPKYVHGDYRRVRQAVSNVIANAMQSTTTGFVRIEYFVTEVLEYRARVEIVVHDTGCGMSNEQLDNLFQDLEQVNSASTGASEAFGDSLEHSGEGRTLGLGLAVVARIVRNMNGQLRVKSEEGEGSKFVIQVPFELANRDALEEPDASDTAANSVSNLRSLASVTKTPPPTEPNEVLLVDRGGWDLLNLPQLSLSRSRSLDELRSISSLKSNRSTSAHSNKSAVDRLMDAIHPSSPRSEGDQEAIENQLQNSEGGPSWIDADASSPHSRTLPGLACQTGMVGQLKLPPTSFPALKLPEGRRGVPHTREPQTAHVVSSEKTGESGQLNVVSMNSTPPRTKPEQLRVIVAEDDPINMKVLTKRLGKAGHKVQPVVNGDDCATLYREKPHSFDVILMDMQMPIVDGLTSTKLIRAFEKSDDFPRSSASDCTTSRHDHIPIFAVSASLVEKNKDVYTEAGFDGWILKPINFERLNILLKGITCEDVREQCLYQPGEWECGGWFGR